MKTTNIYLGLGRNTSDDIRVNNMMYCRVGGMEGKRAAFLPENDALQVEWVLYDSCGGDAHPEHILLSGKIVGICNAIQIGKITTGRPVRGEQRERERETEKQLYKA